MGAAIAITVDGQPAKALPGQSVAAALMADGRDSWRTTRGGERARGVFCGIGACFDCLVVVNGLPDVRACQRTVSAGDSISTQHGAVLPPTRPPTPTPTAGGHQSDFVHHLSVLRQAKRSGGAQGALGNGVRVVPVVVVGAGPAGMSAAVAAADAGREVLLVDAAASVGGQFNRQLPAEFRARRPEKLQHGWRAFARLRDRIAADPMITHLSDTSVWAVERPTDVCVGRTRLWLQTGPADAAGRQVSAVETPALVLATGAYDRVLPFPGWDLPGVYSAGAAQALAKGQRIAVGKRVLVAGTGPFLLPVAESLVGVGAKVIALLEANHPITVAKGWLSDPVAAAGKFLEGATYAALLARHRIPLKHSRTVIAAHGTNRVEAVTTARLDRDWNPIPGTEERIEVDAVCLGFGFTANLELAVSIRCELAEGAVVVDDNQQTTAPGVWAAGELTGIGGAALAAAEGQVAGAAAASASSPSATSGMGEGEGATRAVASGGVSSAVASRGAASAVATGGVASAVAGGGVASAVATGGVASAVAGGGVASAVATGGAARTVASGGVARAVAKGKRFAVALAAAYPVRDGWLGWSDSGTVVCRCEEVERGAVEEAVGVREVEGARSLKLACRAGLGMCQGRVCGRNVAAISGVKQGDGRPVGQPVRLVDLASAEQLEDL
nr:FAD-dependent oxidoreductase [Streptomyces sp. SID13031]